MLRNCKGNRIELVEEYGGNSCEICYFIAIVHELNKLMQDLVE